MFVRSTVIGNNDFGYRAALLPQFFLLLLAGDLLQSWRTQNRASFIAKTPLRQKFVLTLIVLGVAGTVYQAVILRFFLPLEAGLPISGFSSIPAEAFDARTAFAQFDSVSSPAAVIAINPIDSLPEARGDVVPPFTFYIRTLLLNANRQILTAEPHCAAHFGGDIAPCSAIEQGTAHLYAQPAPSAGWASGYCSRFHVQYLVASELDPAWRDPAGWVWTLTPITAQPSVRILQCAPATTP